MRQSCWSLSARGSNAAAIASRRAQTGQHPACESWSKHMDRERDRETEHTRTKPRARFKARAQHSSSVQHIIRTAAESTAEQSRAAESAAEQEQAAENAAEQEQAAQSARRDLSGARRPRPRPPRARRRRRRGAAAATPLRHTHRPSGGSRLESEGARV
eukprot:2506532-Rhodomonas_salina.4